MKYGATGTSSYAFPHNYWLLASKGSILLKIQWLPLEKIYRRRCAVVDIRTSRWGPVIVPNDNVHHTPGAIHIPVFSRLLACLKHLSDPWCSDGRLSVGAASVENSRRGKFEQLSGARRKARVPQLVAAARGRSCSTTIRGAEQCATKLRPGGHISLAGA
jgi:hypothetical protein